MNLTALRPNLSEDHYIAALLPGLRADAVAAVEFILAGEKRSFREEKQQARVVFKPYYGALASNGRLRRVPDLVIFIGGLIVTFEFKLMTQQSFSRILNQISTHCDSVLKD